MALPGRGKALVTPRNLGRNEIVHVLELVGLSTHNLSRMPLVHSDVIGW